MCEFCLSQFLSVNLEYYIIFLLLLLLLLIFICSFILVDNIPNYFRFKSVKFIFRKVYIELDFCWISKRGFSLLIIFQTTHKIVSWNWEREIHLELKIWNFIAIKEWTNNNNSNRPVQCSFERQCERFESYYLDKNTENFVLNSAMIIQNVKTWNNIHQSKDLPMVLIEIFTNLLI